MKIVKSLWNFRCDVFPCGLHTNMCIKLEIHLTNIHISCMYTICNIYSRFCHSAQLMVNHFQWTTMLYGYAEQAKMYMYMHEDETFSDDIHGLKNSHIHNVWLLTRTLYILIKHH